MQTVIFCGHPDLATSSSHQFLKAATPKTVPFEEIPDPLTPEIIHKHQQLLRQCDRFFVQFPLYWYQAPGRVSKWFEAVLADDFMRTMGHHWQGKEMGIITSVGMPLSEYQAGGSQGYSISELLKPFQALATNLKMTYLPPFVLAQHQYATELEQRRSLVKYQMALTLPRGAHFGERSRWLMTQLAEHREHFPADFLATFDAFCANWETEIDEWETLQAELPHNPW
ncbi:MAG: NAD(P)H-dependent oxidoreductase [Aerococcus sp.]|nr:NAD(P)H-dependent oxidoreductase [Aerococcus sp.]